MLDNNGSPSSQPRKVSVRRSAEERAAIVAESYENGQTVVGVARRHGIIPSQLSGWRSAAKVKSAPRNSGVQFADVVVQPSPPQVCTDSIEVAVGTIVVRLPKNTAAKRITDIAHRLAQGR